MPDAEWIKTALTLTGAVVSLSFGIVAWLAKREVSKRDEEIKDLRENVRTLHQANDDLLKLVPILESLERLIDRESGDRKEIDAQQWSKINVNVGMISDLRTSLSTHQQACQTRYITTTEYDRLERLKERVDQERTAQQDQLARHVEQLIRLIQSRQNHSGRT